MYMKRGKKLLNNFNQKTKLKQFKEHIPLPTVRKKKLNSTKTKECFVL